MQMKLTGFQILIVSAVVLLMGVPCAILFSKLSGVYPLKRMWQFLLCWWITAGVITPLLVHKEGDLLMAILVGGGMYGFGLVWFFCIGYQAFDCLVPKNQTGLFAGAFSFFTSEYA